MKVLKFLVVLFFAGILLTCTTKKHETKIDNEESAITIPENLSVAVHYYSRSGNTKKVAYTIARTLGLEPVSMTEINEMNENIDVLFLGMATYKNDVDKNVKEYVKMLNKDKLKTVVIFSTAGADSAYPIIKKLLNEKNIHVEEKNYFCLGQILVQNIGHPNNDDLDNAILFTKDIMNEIIK